MRPIKFRLCGTAGEAGTGGVLADQAWMAGLRPP
jgi:hypothetical protein